MKKLSTLALLALAASPALAGNLNQIPIGNDIAMFGVSLVLAGIAARFIVRRSSK